MHGRHRGTGVECNVMHVEHIFFFRKVNPALYSAQLIFRKKMCSKYIMLHSTPVPLLDWPGVHQRHKRDKVGFQNRFVS